MLSLLSQKGAAVVPAPDAVIGGRAVKVFDVTIPVAVIRQEARSSNFSAAVKQALSRDFMSDIRETVFIDHNNRLRRVHYTHSLTSGSGLTTAIDETMDFSDYGTPVSISAPAPSDTVDLQKLLADAKGLGLA
jgi:hypothetical protein